MEYLWKKYEDKINSNNDEIEKIRKEISKIKIKAVLNFFSFSEKDFFEKRYDLEKSISDLNHKNYIMRWKKPYTRWAEELRDSEVVSKYLSISKYINILNSRESSKDLIRILNEFISRKNALGGEISRRTYVGWETAQLLNPPVNGAINFVSAMKHDYYGPFSKLKDSA